MWYIARKVAAVGSMSMGVLLMLAVGCGDGFDADTSSGSGTATGGSGGGSGTCGQGRCFAEGSTCSDDACCPCIWECSAGEWQIQACAGCAEPGCPLAIPAEGSGCGECSSPPSCSYEDCDNGGVVQATCSAEGTWTLASEVCVAAPPCGPDPGSAPCPTGQICVKASITAGPTTDVTYSCEQNPCAPFPTSCDCAVSICTQRNAPLCVSADPRLIQCDNGAD